MKMKKILRAAAALVLSALALTSCVKDNMFQGKCIIESMTYAPTLVNETDDVTVTAVISYIGGGITADIVYKVAGGADQTVSMTGPAEGGSFVGTIPAQPYDSPVEFKVVAKNKDGFETEVTGKYTVGDVPQDYTKLRINELNGNDKFIELYNTGEVKIKLEGIYIQKDDALNWTCDARVIDAGGYLLLYSVDVTADHPEQDPALFFDSGLSAKKNVRIQLFDPSGNSIDDFNITKHPGTKVNGSYGRNADGKWYNQTTATPGAVNVDGTDSVEAWF